MSTVGTALVQLSSDIATQTVAERIDRAQHLAREAATAADFVVLPELWVGGAFDIETCVRLAEPLDGPLVSGFQQIAASTHTWLHMGSFPESDAGHVYNTAVLIDPDGAIAATYRKIHRFGFAEGEPLFITAGEDVVVVDTPLGRTGLATCYDLRFPEQFRALVDAGAETFVLTSGWPTRRIEHWRVLLRARAIENLVWVVAANGVGTQLGTELGGHSAVVSPLGEVLVEGGAGEEILYATVTPGDVPDWREKFPALGDRIDFA